mmetsp:Transcript_16022/g.41199  ORF Transcript_16022/g.41199 Transcript_16022/m.41199 type:complete len:243 (-) Transcript_16022:234-962(-)
MHTPDTRHLMSGSQVATDHHRASSRRPKILRGCRVVRRENFQALVVHVGQKLRRTCQQFLFGLSFHEHAPGLTLTGTKKVTEAGEFHFQVPVIPGHSQILRDLDELVIPQQCDSNAQSTSMLFLDRNLQHFDAGFGHETLTFQQLGIRKIFKLHRLVPERAMHEKMSDASRGDRTGTKGQNSWNGKRAASAHNKHILLNVKDSSERVLGVVKEAIGTRLQIIWQIQKSNSRRVVLQLAGCRL